MQTKQTIQLLNQLESEISDLRRVNYEQSLELKGYRLIERLLGGGDVQGMCVDVLHELRRAKAQLTEQLEEEAVERPAEQVRLTDELIYKVGDRVRFDHALEGTIKSIDGDIVIIEDDSAYVWTRKLSKIKGLIKDQASKDTSVLVNGDAVTIKTGDFVLDGIFYRITDREYVRTGDGAKWEIELLESIVKKPKPKP
jgi:hypothetical protein